LLHNSFADLLRGALDYQQKAPLGFLWSVKGFTLLLGSSELSLRLFSLLTGIGSLVAFLPLARYVLNRQGQWIGMALLALAPDLIFHSVEVKQYSTDCLATILALLFYFRFKDASHARKLWTWAGLGAMLTLFSFPVVFVLGSIALTQLLRLAYEKKKQQLLKSLAVFASWLFIAALSLFLSPANASNAQWLIHWFDIRQAFVNLPPRNLSDLAQPFQVAGTRILAYPLGLLWDMKATNAPLELLLNRPVVALVYLFTGIFMMVKKSPWQVALLLTPFVLAVGASALRLYPLYERLTVFLSPLLIILIAVGCSYLMSRIKSRFCYLLPALLLITPFFHAGRQAIDQSYFGPEKKASFQSQFSYIEQNYKPGDHVYLYWNMKPPYRVYSRLQPYRFKATEGIDVRHASASTAEYQQRLLADLERYRGQKRVWITYSKTLFVEIGDYYGKPEWYFEEARGGKALQACLDKTARRLASSETVDMVVGLYDFSATPQEAGSSNLFQ
jgi:hypothetical protein